MKSYLILAMLILSISFTHGQTKRPLFVLDLASSKYFKTLLSPRQFNFFEDKLLAFNDQAQWAVYNYSTKKESIDNTQTIKSRSYQNFNVVNTTTGSVVYGYANIYSLDEKKRLKSSLKFKFNVDHHVLLYGKYSLLVIPGTDEYIVYDANKRLCSRKMDVDYAPSSYCDSKNVLSMVSEEGLIECRYDTLTNMLVKSFYLYDDNEGYLAYSNEKYVYCIDYDFTKLSIKKRNAQNEHLENVMTIPLKDYFPNLKTNPLFFIEGYPNFRMVEIKGKLHLIYVFNKKLYCYQLDVPNS